MMKILENLLHVAKMRGHAIEIRPNQKHVE